jgi:hypothetical protein
MLRKISAADVGFIAGHLRKKSASRTDSRLTVGGDVENLTQSPVYRRRRCNDQTLSRGGARTAGGDVSPAENVASPILARKSIVQDAADSSA